MALHAKLSPSSMARIMACPASVTESTFIPEQPPSIYAAHGTYLHDWVVREWERPGSVRNAGEATEEEAEDIPIYITLGRLTREDQEYVLTCIDYLKMVLASCSDTAVVRLERKVTLESFGITDIWGTADVTIYDYERGVIHVIDWKFGSGVPVYVEENKQEMCYGAAAMGHPNSAVSKVILHIVQPPLDYAGDWEISAEELTNWVFTDIVRTIEEVAAPEPRYSPSEETCRFCPAVNKCRARYEHAMKEAGQVFQTVRKMPHITNEEKAIAIRMMKDLTQYSKKLYGDAEECLLRGEEIPGFKLVRGRSNRKWLDEQKTIKWLDDNDGDTADRMFTSPKLKSPAQIEKLNRKLKKNESFMNLIHKPPGKLTLVEESDKRPAVNPTMELENAFKV